MVQFTKLRLQGFKSFVEQTELDIGPGLNGIVGPNGCGKSNLVEALRWVMGESSAKKMRGGGMDDVIFAGTSGRPARNNAQVTLVLENHDRSAPKPFEDVDSLEITRKIEREAGSVYRINGKAVRARDVQLLFADTVSGANSAALISQGRVASIINSKPSERRRILEESAGVAGLYARRHEAELRLKAAEANLVRLDDLMGEMENRLSSLKRQARQATRYKNISGHIKDIEALIAWLEWHANHEQLKELKDSFEAAESEVREYMGVITALTKTEAEQSKDLPELRKSDAEISARLQSQILEAQKIEDQKTRIEQEIQRLGEAIEQAQEDISREQVETPEIQKMLSQRLEELRELEQKNTGDDLTGKKRELKIQQEQKLAVLESDLRAAQAEKARLITAQQAAHDTVERAQAEFDRWTEEEHSLDVLLKEHLAQNLDDTKEATLQEKVEHCSKEISAQKQLRKQIHKQIDEAQERLSILRENFGQNKEKSAALQSEINALKGFIKAASQDDFHVVIDDIKAQKGYEKALAKALGEGLNAALDAAAQTYWQEVEYDDLPALPEGVPSLVSLTKAPKALLAALSQIGVVADHKQADILRSSLKPGQILVTAEGAVYRWDGYTAKAEAKSAAAVQLEQKNKLQELEAKYPDFQKQQVDFEAKIQKAESHLQDLKLDLTQVNQRIDEHENLQHDCQSALQTLQSEQEGWKIEKSRLQDRLLQAKEMVGTTSEHLNTAKNELKNQDVVSDAEITSQIDKLEDAIKEQKSEYSEAVQDLERYILETSQLQERLGFTKLEVQRLEERLSKTDERLTVFLSRKTAAEEKLSALMVQPEELSKVFETLQSRVVELEQERREITDILTVREQELSVTKQALKEAEEHLSQARERRAGVQSSLAAIKAQEEMSRAHIENAHNMSPQALSRSLEIEEETQLPSLPETQQKREKLIRERDNMGAVNLRAQEEVAQIESECGVMVTERDDLIAAIEQLREGISKLNREARHRLKEAFESVNTYFKDLFMRLYGGGQAYLELVENDDVLEAGLEIYAQPPGKKLQSLSLLSGGEQTLASIALIFAMFLTNPSPICVLDEIDAPLDDANVDRVCKLLEEIAANGYTRFLIVTHHRMTMARMDRLYGVTMAEKGVSQLVSVDMALQGDLLVEAAE